jgi:two-component system, NarL family, sensor kinase
LSQGSESGSARCGGIAQTLGTELREPVRTMSEKIGVAMNREAGGLLILQSSLIEHYFKLQAAERSLSSRAQELQRPKAISAMRQIELERQRVGRELHTGVGQLLAAIALQTEVIVVQLRNAPEAVGKALNRIATLAAEALEQARSISRRLHPPEWQRLTLEAAIQQLWEMSGIPHTFEASLVIEPLPREPRIEIKVLFYRAVQECLSNITSHAHATSIALLLQPRNDQIALTIEDNGVGFDVTGYLSAPATVTSGIGLRSIREQAASLGGKLAISSRPGSTKLELTAPFVPLES